MSTQSLASSQNLLHKVSLLSNAVSRPLSPSLPPLCPQLRSSSRKYPFHRRPRLNLKRPSPKRSRSLMAHINFASVCTSVFYLGSPPCKPHSSLRVTDGKTFHSWHCKIHAAPHELLVIFLLRTWRFSRTLFQSKNVLVFWDVCKLNCLWNYIIAFLLSLPLQ